MSLFRLIRLPNLLIVALVQSLLYFKLFIPAFSAFGISARLSPFEFVLLIGATICTTACGYIINDLYDYEADKLNRPNKVVVNQGISVQTSIWIYALLSWVGLLLSLYLAFRIGQVYLIGLYIVSFALLFLYTKDFKKRPLIGNLVVALFCAGVAGLVWLSELPGWRQLYELAAPRARALQSVFLWYGAFAFFSTLFREIVKDLEDKAGDLQAGCRTFPIVAGDKVAKLVAGSMGLILILLLLVLYLFQVPGLSNWFFIGAFLSVVTPLAFALNFLQKAQSAADYHRISNLAKWIMLAGVFLLLF